MSHNRTIILHILATSPVLLSLLVTTSCNKDQDNHNARPAASQSQTEVLLPSSPLPAPTTDAPKAEATAEKSSSAYKRTGDKARNIDDFSFLGWSSDGHFFAFETHYHGPQMANCEGEAALTIVDATTDTVAPGGHISFKYSDPEASECGTPPAQRLRGVAPAALNKYGIESQTAGTPDRLVSEHQLYAFASGSIPQKVEFFVKHKSENYDPEGAAYFLALVPGERKKQVIEAGTKRRPYVMNYDLETSMAFVSPDKKRLALFVGMTMSDAEGPRHSWKVNGITLK